MINFGEILANIAYKAWAEGTKQPSFETLSDKQKARWIAAAKAVVRASS